MPSANAGEGAVKGAGKRAASGARGTGGAEVMGSEKGSEKGLKYNPGDAD